MWKRKEIDRKLEELYLKIESQNNEIEALITMLGVTQRKIEQLEAKIKEERSC